MVTTLCINPRTHSQLTLAVALSQNESGIRNTESEQNRLSPAKA